MQSATNGRRTTAVVTGASSGIGRIFALRLAAKGHDLLLVGRNADRLAEVEREAQQCGVAAETIVADLTDETAVEDLAQRIASRDDVDYLINNAGFGTMGDYAALDVQTHLDMAKVHVLATMRLTHAALPAMLQRRRGYVVNVASMSAFLIGPGQATYAATKAMLTSFSESLQAELQGTGVRIQALCPGFTRTGFHDRPAFEGFDRQQIPQRRWMTAETVVDASLAALDRRKVICVPGWKNRLLVRAMGLRPVRKLIGNIVRKK